MKQTLLIIDAQQDLMEGNSEEQGVFEKERLIHTINTVIEKAIREGIPVVFIRDLDVANGEDLDFRYIEILTFHQRLLSWTKRPPIRFMAHR